MANASINFYDRRGHLITPDPHAVIKPRAGVFALVVAVPEKAVLLTREPHALDVPELPGGGIEKGESHEQAIKREWSEEVSIPFDVKGPLATFHHIRGFYEDHRNEFWNYDQTFHLYHFNGKAKLGHKWTNAEKGEASWESLASLPHLSINRAHWCAIPKLLRDAGLESAV